MPDTAPADLTPRQRFIAALERRPLPGLVPHFELEFFLTMEVFGKVHISQRHYGQWDQMEEKERQLHIADLADIEVMTAERYGWSAMKVSAWDQNDQMTANIINAVRKKAGDTYFLMVHGGATFGVPDGDEMISFSYRLADEPDKVKDQAQRMVDDALARGEWLRKNTDLDGMLCATDFCFNTGPFLSPDQFAEFVTPYNTQLHQGYREQGYYTILHTDGNIMPIVDQLVGTGAHALHSLDPQAGVDIAEIVSRYGDQIALCGNVNCALMDTGTAEQVEQSTRYAIEHGLKAPGYIFCTSNCVYTGMPLERYEQVHRLYRELAIRS